jgi:6-pyruvoyltetrahydropterin/6-carboxytetrahydropterin synthase
MDRLEFTYRFESAHRFTQSCSESCATPHGHTWRATLAFQTREGASSLNSVGMVDEFIRLKKNWKTFISETADHSFFHHAEDPILPALRTHIPLFRGLPFPGDPTTELIARLFFLKAEAMDRGRPSLNVCAPVALRVRETPTNTVIFRPTAQNRDELESFRSFTNAWWNSADPLARGI